MGVCRSGRRPCPPRGHIGTEEKEAVIAYLDRVIASGTLGAYQGEEEEAYCAQFAEYLGGGYADAVSSGSTAIYVALKALQLEAFSEVIIGPFTDPGGMMPIPLQNMVPMIADSAPGSYNTGPEQIEELISDRTSAVVVPHIAGEPADMGGIMEVARRHGIPVIEDCAQAHGTRSGAVAGSFGDISAFSTMSGKHHSSGGQGGMVFTRDERSTNRFGGWPTAASPIFAGRRHQHRSDAELQPDRRGGGGGAGAVAQTAGDGRA
ncbi:Putative L-glutamine:3-amino-2,3-dideoxy-scyllo-inosose aminotransferase [Geodia barretti]|uniref:L-glutamine:3-amino-2,3-dideoxy-scyllo-inosose aminotransferase n=1 Tax=Geodia barretti TaxID=519541 RepID=A0AA35SC36_GEOBA|nr:Putative L-glutamine:3-amino-2,3-dideoxy-scyllo-inosose aminotransferase [Geodia barretti]